MTQTVIPAQQPARSICPQSLRLMEFRVRLSARRE